MTKGQLYNYHSQLERMAEQGSVIFHLLKGRVRDFYKENGIIIDGINRDIRTIQERYFVIEGNEVKTEGEEKTPVYQEGKTKEMFEAEFKRLMETPAVIKFKHEEEEEVAA